MVGITDLVRTQNVPENYHFRYANRRVYIRGGVLFFRKILCTY